MNLLHPSTRGCPETPPSQNGRKPSISTTFSALRKCRRPQAKNAYCIFCRGRSDPTAMNSRPALTLFQAKKAVRTKLALLQGGPVKPRDFAEYLDARVFCAKNGQGFCSCLAYMPTRFCHHALACELYRGARERPATLDDTPVEKPQRGAKRRAPDRYHMDQTARFNEQELEIKRLKAELAARPAIDLVDPPQPSAATRQVMFLLFLHVLIKLHMNSYGNTTRK